MLAPSPFSPTIPHFQLAWDSVSLGALKRCEKYYEYTILGNWTTRTRSVHLEFGGLYAAALERYAHAKASGSSHDTATLTMVRWALENSGERVCAVCGGTGADPIDETDRCGQCFGRGTGNRWKPWTPEGEAASLKNRYTLIRTLVWNVEDRLGTPFQTLILANGKPATELSFSFPLTEIEGEEVSYCGHMDEVVTYEGAAWVKDDKTTKNSLDANYRQHFTPDNQMSGYTVAGKIVLQLPVRGVLVRAAQVGVNFNRFATFPVPRPQAVLDEWTRDAQVWIKRARENAERGFWPLNDRACFGCEFRKVCAVSPSHRDAWLKEDYVQRKPWNPLETRGDV